MALQQIKQAILPEEKGQDTMIINFYLIWHYTCLWEANFVPIKMYVWALGEACQ